jgi:ketosteroid isomerase-like protein
MTEEPEPIRLATTLFDAVVTANGRILREVYSEQAVLKSYAGGGELSVDEVVDLVKQLIDQIPDYAYVDVRCSATVTGFVRQHSIKGTSPNGDLFEIPVCCVATVEAGRITLLEEYGDSAAMAALGF